MTETPSQVEKIMSATLGDFQRSIKTLAPDHKMNADGRSIELDGNGYALGIRFEPIEPKLHGGLLKIPRAKVTLTFENTSPKAQKDFIERFDFAFRRGGG